MALATQCPHCYTCFRVANDQLKLHAGLVRCGVCQSTFNGIEHLLAPGVQPQQPSEQILPPAAAAEPAPAVPTNTVDAIDVASTSFHANPTHAEAAVTNLNAAADSTDAPALRAGGELDFDLDFEEPQLLAQAETPVTRTEPEPADQHDAHPQPDPYSLDFDIDAWSTVGADDKAEPTSDVTDTTDSEEHIEPTLWSENPSDEIAMQHTIAVPPVSDDEEQETTSADLHTDADAAGTALAEAEDIKIVESDDTEVAEVTEEAFEEEELPGFVAQAEKQKKYGRLKRGLLWSLTPLLLLSAVGQATYLWRNELAAQIPQTKPWLVQACAALNTITHCRIKLPAQIESISIESNELQSLSDKRKLFALNLQLQNHASTAQAWPNIALTLDNAKDKAVIRRIFVPNDYLPIKTDPTIIGRGFAANGEQNIKLYFELEGVEAAGYHVGTYYP